MFLERKKKRNQCELCYWLKEVRFKLIRQECRVCEKVWEKDKVESNRRKGLMMEKEKGSSKLDGILIMASDEATIHIFI